MTPTEQQAAQDSIHDLVKDAVDNILMVRRADISEVEKDQSLRDALDSLYTIDTLRRNC